MGKLYLFFVKHLEQSFIYRVKAKQLRYKRIKMIIHNKFIYVLIANE